MSDALVSVVIPAFNAVDFVSDAIDSVFRQAYRPLELVVVNDGSTDNTADSVRERSSAAPSGVAVTLVDIEENRGAANALRVGFEKAQGEYLCWLSADDLFIDVQKTRYQVMAMKELDADWSYFKSYFAGADLQSARLVRPDILPWQWLFIYMFEHNPEFRPLALMFQNPVNGSSIMVSRKSISNLGLFDPALKNVDADGDLWLRYSILGAKVLSLDGAPIFYRMHGRQTSQKRLEMIRGMEVTRLRILAALSKLDLLGRMISDFSIPLSFILMRRVVSEEAPFTTIFISNMILDKPVNRNPFLRWAANLAYGRAIESAVYRELGERTLEEARVSSKSKTFLDFLQRLEATKLRASSR